MTDNVKISLIHLAVMIFDTLLLARHLFDICIHIGNIGEQDICKFFTNPVVFLLIPFGVLVNT